MHLCLLQYNDQGVLLENFHDVTWVRKHWGTSLHFPSEAPKDTARVPMGDKFTPGEPLDFLEEEVGSHKRQAEIVDVNMQNLLNGYNAQLTMQQLEEAEKEEMATGQVETAAALECMVCSANYISLSKYFRLRQVCLEEMVSSTRIFNCLNGHCICETCKYLCF